MAVSTKVLTTYNINSFATQLEDLILEGWRLNRSISIRKSLGNRFTAVLTLGEDTSEQEVSVSEEKVDSVSESTDKKVEKDVEVEVKEEVKAPKQTRTKATAKVEKEAE